MAWWAIILLTTQPTILAATITMEQCMAQHPQPTGLEWLIKLTTLMALTIILGEYQQYT
jgi:hypothetical protein